MVRSREPVRCRLRIRWERDPVVQMAFLTLACALICRRYLMGF
jgi:hypothetical protein